MSNVIDLSDPSWWRPEEKYEEHFYFVRFTEDGSTIHNSKLTKAEVDEIMFDLIRNFDLSDLIHFREIFDDLINNPN